MAGSADEYERAVEVRDKPIQEGDFKTLVDSAMRHGMSVVAMLAVSTGQRAFDESSGLRSASVHGVRLRIFWGWKDLVKEVLFWTAERGSATGIAARSIAARLQDLEVSNHGMALWSEI